MTIFGLTLWQVAAIAIAVAVFLLPRLGVDLWGWFTGLFAKKPSPLPPEPTEATLVHQRVDTFLLLQQKSLSCDQWVAVWSALMPTTPAKGGPPA